MSSPSLKPRQLRRLQISEISLVDRPANHGARIMLAKRHAQEPANRGQALMDLAVKMRVAKLAQRTGALPHGRTGYEARSVSKADAMEAGRASAMAILKGARTAAIAKSAPTVPIQAQVTITKLGTEDQRYIAGWASVVAVDGKPVVDTQGDQIDEVDLVEAAHSFLASERQGLVMHKGAVALTIVESVVIRPEVAAAMGVTTDTTGWWIGAKVHDDAAWARVKSGELRALSIAGNATFDDGE